MYKSIADGFKVINATEGFKGFTLVSINPSSHADRLWKLVSPDRFHRGRYVKYIVQNFYLEQYN
jgi:hypothetical protein